MIRSDEFLQRFAVPGDNRIVFFVNRSDRILHGTIKTIYPG